MNRCPWEMVVLAAGGLVVVPEVVVVAVEGVLGVAGFGWLVVRRSDVEACCNLYLLCNLELSLWFQ